MTVTGGDAPDDQTRIDREPPVFPRVGDSPASNTDRPAGTSRSEGPLFTPADGRDGTPLTEPVAAQAVARPSGGDGRLRWAVAGLATLLVIAVVGGFLLLAGPRAGTPSVVAHYAPADSAAYAEARLDLPGDQRDHLVSFMSNFPGFADPSSFQQKLDEMLNELVRSSETGVDWTNDVDPWFGGHLGVFGSTFTPTAGTPPSMVVALTVKDRAKLESLIESRLGQTQVETQDYQGVQIRTITPQPGGERISFAVTDEIMLVGTRIEDVRAALDVKAGATAALADDQFFLQQLGALHADRLATLYLNLGGAIGSMPIPTGSGLPAACMQTFQSVAKVKLVGELRAEPDHLALTVRSQAPADAGLPPLPANKTSVLAESMPADTAAYAEFRGAGASAGWLIGQLLTCMDTSGSGATSVPDIGQLFEQFIGTQPQDYLDFVDDAAVGVTYSNGKLSGGLVATVDDEAVARGRVDKLLALAPLLGMNGPRITTEKVDHNGTTITVIHLTDGQAGRPPMSVSVAVSGGRLYIGLDDFVTAALDRSAADSLATNAHFKSALAAGGTSNAGVVYLDIQALLGAAVAKLPTDQRAHFESDVKPFLAPLTTFAMISRTDGGISVGNVFLFVE